MRLPFKRKSKSDKSLENFHGEAATHSMENAAAAYQAPSMVACGAQAADVGVASTLTNLVYSVLLFKLLPAMRTKIPQTMKGSVLSLALFDALTWLPLVVALLFWGKVAPSWLLVLWLVNLVPAVLVTPLRDNWLAGIIPGSRMGKYLSLRSAISAATYIGSFLAMGYVLDMHQNNIFGGYALVCFIGFGASFASFIFYSIIRAPKKHDDDETRDKFSFSEFIHEISRSKVGSFVLFISLFTFAVNISGPFFVVYMLNDLHFTYLTYTLMISAEYIARILSLGFWGRYVDKVGSLKVMGVVCRMVPVIPILWIFSSHLGYLICVQVVSGLAWAAFDLCNQTYIYKVAPAGRRFHYILYHKSLTMMSVALGSLVGAYLLGVIPPFLGSTILSLFIISAVLRLVLVVGMFSKVSKADVLSQPRMVIPTPVVKRKPRQDGLYYQPHLWEDYFPAPRYAAVRSSGSPIQRGLFYKQEQWNKYLGETKTLVHSTPVITGRLSAPVIAAKGGVYYKPELWNKLALQTEVITDRPAAKVNRRATYKPAAVDA